MYSTQFLEIRFQKILPIFLENIQNQRGKYDMVKYEQKPLHFLLVWEPDELWTYCFFMKGISLL